MKKSTKLLIQRHSGKNQSGIGCGQLMRLHRLYIKKEGNWLRLYQGSQLSHMKRFKEGLEKQGKEVRIESDEKKVKVKR